MADIGREVLNRKNLAESPFGRGDGSFELGHIIVARLGAIAFGAHDEDGLGIAGPNEAPAVVKFYAHAVDGVDLIIVGEEFGHFSWDLKLELLGAISSYFFGGVGGGHIGEECAEGLRSVGEDFREAAGGVEGVIKTKEAIIEEDVAAHFTREVGVGLFDLGFDEAVSDASHDGGAAMAGDVVEEGLRAFDFADNGSAGVVGKDLSGEENQEAIAPDDASLCVDDADAIAIAVVGDTEITTFVFDGGDEILEIFWDGRVGVVVGEGAVGFGVELGDFDAHRIAEEFRGEESGDAVAAVHGDVKFAIAHFDIVSDPLDIVFAKVRQGGADGFGVGIFKVFVLNELPKFLDGLAV